MTDAMVETFLDAWFDDWAGCGEDMGPEWAAQTRIDAKVALQTALSVDTGEQA